MPRRDLFLMSPDPVKSPLQNGREAVQSFFAEAARLWKVNSEFVLSRQFFELWEASANPVPFILGPDGFSVSGTKLMPPDSDLTANAFFQWDSERQCPVFVVEGSAVTLEYPLHFSPEGTPVFEGPEEKESAVETEADEARKFDLVLTLKEKFPDTDFETIHRTAFHKLLDSMKGNGSISLHTIAALKRLKAESVRELFRRCLADRAADERTCQLELPLFGTYSRHDTGETAEVVGKIPFIEAETGWKVSRMLEILSETAQQMIEHERNFVLSFAGAAILRKDGPESIIRLRVPEGAPIMQEDILTLKLLPEQIKFGTFRTDFFDGEQVIGRLTAEPGLNCTNARLQRMEGTLLRGPSEMLRERFEEIRGEFQTHIAHPEFYGAGAAILGMKKITFDFPENGGPASLNASQKLAFSAAVAEQNELVIIQGPPGTGKTHVLEQIVRELHARKKRVLIVAPSHTAVDNICRRIMELPFLRCGSYADSIAPEISAEHWSGNRDIVKKMHAAGGGHVMIFAGTPAAILKDIVIKFDAKTDGLFDTIIFDEAGMSGIEDIFLCALYAKRAVLVGDHKQLPPFPKPEAVIRALERHYVLESSMKSMIMKSAMEYLIAEKKIPSIRLRTSYRCRNPRLLRFISGTFYDAGVLPDVHSDYYKLPVPQREDKYPRTSLLWITTSKERVKRRSEDVVIPKQGSGKMFKPGICNRLEAAVCVKVVQSLLQRYELEEITVISPYRAQIKLIRNALAHELEKQFPPERWKKFLNARISTVDSFQGGESDAVVVSYVRSGNGIGFVDDPNRINVAHTRCRCELIAVGDLDCLKKFGRGKIFDLLEKAFLRDGAVVPSSTLISEKEKLPELPSATTCPE